MNSTTLHDVKAGVNQLNQRQDNRDHLEEWDKILEWFSDFDQTSQQRDIITRRQEGTGMWILHSDEFRTWLHQPGSTLLCKGPPGVGKTVISAMVIDHLQTEFRNDPAIGVAYFYFTYQTRQDQNYEMLLRNILRQFLECAKILPTEIVKLFQHCNEGKRQPSSPELEEAFHTVLRSYDRSFIILDALDERHASDSRGLLTIIDSLHKLKDTSPFNLIATSRDIFTITSRFQQGLVKEIQAREDDVKSYVSSRIGELLDNGVVHSIPDLVELVKMKVTKATGDM